MNSAIITGGWEQVVAALVGAWMLAFWIGGWTGIRVAVFFVLWQAFTPLREWWVDLPALIICTLALEAVYARLARRLKRLQSE